MTIVNKQSEEDILFVRISAGFFAAGQTLRNHSNPGKRRIQM